MSSFAYNVCMERSTKRVVTLRINPEHLTEDEADFLAESARADLRELPDRVRFRPGAENKAGR
jgi:hypothetical protein